MYQGKLIVCLVNGKWLLDVNSESGYSALLSSSGFGPVKKILGRISHID